MTPVAEATSTGEGPGPRADDPARFGLLASAIAGRSVEVAPARPGQLPWTDGTTVFVKTEEDPDRQVASVVVQASLLGAGSLNDEVLPVLRRRQGLARRYLAVEGHRALSVQGHLVPRSLSGLVDRAVASRTRSAAQSLAIASSREVLDGPPEAFGTILPGRYKAPPPGSPADRGVAGPHDPRREPGEDLRELDDNGPTESPVADVFSSPIGGGGGIGRLLKRLFTEGRSAVSGQLGQPGADSPTHWSRRGARGSRAAMLSTALVPIPDAGVELEQRRTTYPEWDVHARRYRPGWCTVSEDGPAPSELAPMAPPDTHALRRPLVRLGMDLERHHRQRQGDDLDIDAAVEARVELMAGSLPDEAVYIDTLRTRRDLSVLLLLDVSGSAGEPSTTGVPVHIHQRAAAGALAAALDQLGDRVALYGFRSAGRSAVQVVPVKRFGDELDASAMLRLGGLVPGAYTRLGAAIRHGTALLEREAGTSARLLAVLSDGLAYDHGYERAYGEADARLALTEARRRGIGTLCLSIGAETPAGALRRVFGTAAYAAIPDIERLPSVIGPLFRSALRSAELQRKRSQRRDRTQGRLAIERKTA